MSAGNKTFIEHYLVTTISPQLVDADSASSDWVYAGNATNLVGIVTVGATDAAVNAKLEQATDSSGTGAKDVTDADADWEATDDNKDGVIQVECTHLDTANNFSYVRLTITVEDGTAGGYVAGVLLNESRHKPVTQPAKLAHDVKVLG